ncbi:MAG: radical SAM protein, partial [Myxococcales bacterium]
AEAGFDVFTVGSPFAPIWHNLAINLRPHAELSRSAPWGYVARAYVRSVEVNTIYHVLPGARALTFGMYGCDLRCPYCHNWKVSQALREPTGETGPVDTTARALVERALAEGCRVLCAAYNEPMIAVEWVREVFTAAKARGLRTAVISDGNTTAEALEHLRGVTDVFRVDLKGATAEQYRTLGGRPGPVFEAIRRARELGFWVEVVTLVVPGFNDDPATLRQIGLHLRDVDPSIPWHLNAFHPRYRLAHLAPTPAFGLISAAGSAYALGLAHVYVGNLDESFGELSHTRCPGCHETLIERSGYEVTASHLVDGGCGRCGAPIAGIW